MPNRLKDQLSPYLQSHAHNPVNWYPWCEEAFSEAVRRDVPVFVSIGYSSCHWCHVMERESFNDDEVAKILNDNFVSIKVDREERPDIDNLYMDACVAINGSGGWPMTVFLNHDKTPFFAGTYYRQSAFINLLERVSHLWMNNRDMLTESGAKITERLKDLSIKERGAEINYDKLYQKIARYYDPVCGGFFEAPKFPGAGALLFLLRYNILNPNSNSGRILKKTLDNMANGGIFDHIGGGFFRYSTDRKWLVPHFEKMLYDNALLLQVYAEASRSIKSGYKYIAERTAQYVFRTMQDEDGGFYTAEDADSEGIEGKYYLFSPDEIFYILGREGENFSEDYDITAEGNFEGKSIPNRIGKGIIPYDDRLGEILHFRNKRIPPFKDDKITLSSNCLMISSLCISGRLLNRREYIENAARCADFILSNFFVDGRLMARWRLNEAKHPSTLDDYAYLSNALIELYFAENNIKWLKKATEISDEILRLFSDGRGALFLSGKDVEDLPIRQKVINDSALPSGNAVAAYNFLRLYDLTGKDQYLTTAENILSESQGSMEINPYGHAGMLIASLYREYGKCISLTDGEGLDKMLKAAEGFRPFTNLSVIKEDSKDIAELIRDMKYKKSLEGKATAYICDKSGCRPPVTDYKKFMELI